MAVDAGSPVDIFKNVLTTKYADFSGRARRAEYWWFALLSNVLIIGLIVVGAIVGQASSIVGTILLILGFIVALAMLVPSLAAGVRRLHDTGKTGWLMLLSFIPFGSLVLLYFMVIDGDQGSNEHGPSPKYGA